MQLKKPLSITVGVLTLAFGGCVVSPPSGASGTAAERFAALHGNGAKSAFKEAYYLGEGDQVKRLYWAGRNVNDTADNIALTGASDDEPKLKRKYVVLPVPAHTAPDGIQVEAHNETVEVVQ
jgi:hypothetical protein